MSEAMESIPEDLLKLPRPSARLGDATEEGALLHHLRRFHRVNALIMVRYVQGYASPARPSVADLYRHYCTELSRYNAQQHVPDKLPRISKYMFRSAIDLLDPVAVLSARHGPDALRKFLRRTRHIGFQMAMTLYIDRRTVDQLSN